MWGEKKGEPKQISQHRRKKASTEKLWREGGNQTLECRGASLLIRTANRALPLVTR